MTRCAPGQLAYLTVGCRHIITRQHVEAVLTLSASWPVHKAQRRPRTYPQPCTHRPWRTSGDWHCLDAVHD
jgi:hypothetical protein